MKKDSILRAIAALVLVQVIGLPLPAAAQAPADRDAVYAAIRKEASENSKIMHSLHILTDLYGPRLTGSPNHVNAAKWIQRELNSWGFENTMLEPWEFGHPGWVNERNYGLMLSPVADTLTFEVLAWTPSTKGPAIADAVSIVPPTGPTAQELADYLAGMKAVVAGKIVLVGRPSFIDQSKEPPAKHISEEDAKRRFDPNLPESERQNRPGRPAVTPTPTPVAGVLTSAQVNEHVDRFLVENGALVRINESQLDRGAVRAFNNRTFDTAKVVPTVVMRNEDFGRIYRLLQDKTPVRLEFDLRSRIVPDGVTSYNVVGDIPGSDKKDEVVMLGGHLDSWHSATGATDNAIGCATMMEAARILKAIGVKPRRTIRVACWSGEEQGLLGSKAYVQSHFGTFEDQKPDWSKFNGYFNIDSGTGRARGLTVFGPPEAATVLREALAPFADLGFAGVVATKSRATGGTDSTSFNAAGLPGIGASQDPIEYFNVTWHTNLDTYERIIEPDVKASAQIFAAAVWTLAMRDEMLPRFAPAEMPAPAITPTPTPTATPRP